MRCLACNKRLNKQESVRKYASTGTFIDLCNDCFRHVSEDIPDIDSGTEIKLPNEEDFNQEEKWDYQQSFWGNSE